MKNDGGFVRVASMMENIAKTDESNVFVLSVYIQRNNNNNITTCPYVVCVQTNTKIATSKQSYILVLYVYSAITITTVICLYVVCVQSHSNSHVYLCGVQHNNNSHICLYVVRGQHNLTTKTT